MWFEFVLQDDDDQKVAIMRKAFQLYDTAKTGYIETLKISTILNTMGQLFDDNELQALIEENDPEGEWSHKSGLNKVIEKFLDSKFVVYH